ncbi:MAG: type II toxin-antitoxin system Phd/YefM family antitoxin [Halochromatium sp.]|uniref:type II toxin-antitoxin system Phd/YefM family antitoxin n=1 Tax=Halochromatium sp. TaxID=2049430 RepID=UPI00397D1E23
MQVAVRDLKTHLSRVLSQAQAGEPIEVTSRNRLIARIVGVPTGTAERLRESIASGALTWSERKPQLQQPLKLAADPTPVSRMVLEDRG